RAFDDAVAAHRVTVDIGREVAAGRTAAVAHEGAGRDGRVHAAGRAVGCAALQLIAGAGIAVVAAGRAARRRIAGLAGLDDAIATPGDAIGVVGRVAAGRAAGVAGQRAGGDLRMGAHARAGAPRHAVARTDVAVIAVAGALGAGAGLTARDAGV